MKQNLIYTVKQISLITGFGILAIYEKIESLKLIPNITKDGKDFYDENSLSMIVKSLEIELKSQSFTKYYPIKTTENFCIYESKMNYQE